jgi:hypothetical protein
LDFLLKRVGKFSVYRRKGDDDRFAEGSLTSGKEVKYQNCLGIQGGEGGFQL